MVAEGTSELQLVVFIAYVAVMIVLAVALYRTGRRRASAPWWIAAVFGALALILLPFVGLVGAGLVLVADRKST
jgi:NADH:ubiquinone oxidoreductase subunit 6 (subunit J)